MNCTRTCLYAKNGVCVLKLASSGATNRCPLVPDDCPESTPYKPHMTNGDRIRAMTDEDLAKFLCTVCSCYGCKARMLCDIDETGSECDQIIENWLKQPAEEEA